MKLPDITHLQALVLGAIGPAKRSGREIRARLAEAGAEKSGPAFYQLMGRMEDDKLVKGWYDQKIIDGQIIKERKYELTVPGLRAYNACRDFYAALPAAGKDVKSHA